MKNSNLLYIKNPKLFKQILPTKNKDLNHKELTCGSNVIIWWECKKGHRWPASVKDRHGKRSGCPYCTNKKVCSDNNLLITNPKLASEWHPTKNGKLTPSDVVSGSNKKVFWKCIYGHEWNAIINSRSRGAKCLRCSRKRASDVEVKFFYFLRLIFKKTINTHSIIYNKKNVEIDIFIPELNLAIEYDGFFFHKNSKKTNIDIEKNNILNICGIPLIRIREKGLKKIHHTEFVHNFKNVKTFKTTLFQLILYIIDNFNLTKKQERNAKKILNMNVENHMIPNEIFYHFLKDNNLVNTHPNLVKEWHPFLNGKLKPEHVTHGSTNNVYWICEKGHIWEASINSRTSRNTGCKTCYNLYKRPKQLKKMHLKLLKPVRQINLKTKKCINIFYSIKDAKAQTGILNISQVCRGINKTAGGYVWEFIK